jgi:hypothetical protein
MSGGDGMDSALEYMLSGVHGLLWPRPIILGTQTAPSCTPGVSNAYLFLRALGMFGQRPGSHPRSRREAGWFRQVVKSCLPAPIIGWKKRKRGLVLFRLVAPPLQPGVLRLYLVRVVWFPNHLPLEGINRIQNFGS